MHSGFWDALVGKGLLYYGTDVRGGWGKYGEEATMKQLFEWEEPEYEGAFLRHYDGREPNLAHDYAFRRLHHVPLFRSELEKMNAPFLLEWWLSPSGEPDPYRPRWQSRTLVHYCKDNRRLASFLADWQFDRALQEETVMEEGYALNPQLAGDLPHMGIPNELIIETFHPRSWPLVPAKEYRGWAHMAIAVYELSEKLRDFYDMDGSNG